MPLPLLRPILDWIPTWEALRPIGRSRAARMTMVMPIIGFLIIFNKELEKAFYLSEKLIGIPQEQSMSLTAYNLYFLYFGLLLFSLSNVAFATKCPRLIKQFEGEHNYCNRELEIISRRRFDDMVHLLSTIYAYQPKRTVQEPSDAAARVAGADNRNNREFWLRSNSDLIMETLQTYYDKHNRQGSVWRAAVSLGYLISFAIMAIPTATTSYKILFNIIL
jgi:hypothetical protein